jgi:UDP-N-acetylglucosamine 2-epimerase
MRILIVGEGPGADAVGEGLEASGVEVERRADDPPPADGAQEIGEIANDLRELERALGDRGADAVLIASDSPAALAAVVVAKRAGIPVARLEVSGGGVGEGANARLIRQLADAALAPDPAAIAEWARDGYPARA